MQICYFLANFGFVLINTLKPYRKKFSLILLRKIMFNSLLALFFWKACTFSNFEIYPCWKSRNYSHSFLSKSCSEIYLSQIISYWIRFFTLYLTWGAFSFVCVLSVLFFFFLLFFFFFDRHFPLMTVTIHRTTWKGEGVLIFLVSHFHLLMNINLVHRDFYHLCLIDLFVIARLIADETCSP